MLAWDEWRRTPRQSFLSGKLLSRWGAAKTAPHTPGWRRVQAPPVQGVLWWSHFRQQVEELQEEVSRPHCIKEGEQEIDGVLFETLQEEILGPCGTDFQRLPDKELQQRTDSTLEKEAPWSLVTHGNRISLRSPFSYVPTSNRYEALAVDKANKQDSQGETAPAAHTKSHKRKQRVLVVGDCQEKHRHPSASSLYSEGKFAACQEPRYGMSQGDCHNWLKAQTTLHYFFSMWAPMAR